MGIIKLMVSDETEEMFRKSAMHRFGYTKGALSEAGDLALSQWARIAMPHEKSKINPFKEFRGILKHVKMTSVELQKQTIKEWGERYARHRR